MSALGQALLELASTVEATACVLAVVGGPMPTRNELCLGWQQASSDADRLRRLAGVARAMEQELARRNDELAIAWNTSGKHQEDLDAMRHERDAALILAAQWATRRLAAQAAIRLWAMHARGVTEDYNAAMLNLRDVMAERDEARAVARTLVHAYEHDSRPPAAVVATALSYPVRP